jgi:hypothetical protein
VIKRAASAGERAAHQIDASIIDAVGTSMLTNLDEVRQLKHVILLSGGALWPGDGARLSDEIATQMGKAARSAC